MTEQTVRDTHRTRSGAPADVPTPPLRLRTLLAGAAVALVLSGGAMPAHAVNGDIEGAGALAGFAGDPDGANIIFICNDAHTEGGVQVNFVDNSKPPPNEDLVIKRPASCHQWHVPGGGSPTESNTVDDGLAAFVNATGTIHIRGDSEFVIELDKTIERTAQFEFNTGNDGSQDFTVVCATWGGVTNTPGKGKGKKKSTTAAGKRDCLTIYNGAPPSPIVPAVLPLVQGAFSLSGDSGTECADHKTALQTLVPDPQVGFFCKADTTQAGDEGWFNCTLCSGRTVSSDTLGKPSAGYMGNRGVAVIHTPICFQNFVAPGLTTCF